MLRASYSDSPMHACSTGLSPVKLVCVRFIVLSLVQPEDLQQDRRSQSPFPNSPVHWPEAPSYFLSSGSSESLSTCQGKDTITSMNVIVFFLLLPTPEVEASLGGEVNLISLGHSLRKLAHSNAPCIASEIL